MMSGKIPRDSGKPGWWAGNSGDKIYPVGRKKPNAFGLYDMLGNAVEWCSDWYDVRYYEASPVLNPPGSDRGKQRVLRGGDYLHTDSYERAAHRNGQDPKVGKPFYGFRLVLDSVL